MQPARIQAPPRHHPPAPARPVQPKLLAPAPAPVTRAPAVRPPAPPLPAVRVVQRHGAGRPVPPAVHAPGTVIQRVKASFSVYLPDKSHGRAKEIAEFATALRDAVDRAYRYVLKNPLLGPFADLDGHTRHWIRTWNLFKQTGDSSLAAAAFGYAIESLASHVGSSLRPAVPVGLRMQLQGERGGTRPDVILWDGTREIAWYDITASNSKEHIFKQKTGWDGKDNVFEIVYPSTDITELSFIAQSLSGVDDLDDNEIHRQIEFQKYYLEQIRSIFKEEGKKLFGGTPPPRFSPHNRDEKRREWTLERLGRTYASLGHTFDPREAADILYAFGKNPATYGFTSSLSRSTGEHLLRTIRNIPNLTAPREPLGRPLSGTSYPFQSGSLFPGGFQATSNTFSNALVPVDDNRLTAASRLDRHRRHKHTSLAVRLKPIRDAAWRIGQRLGSGRTISMINFAALFRENGVTLDRFRRFELVVQTPNGSETFHVRYTGTRSTTPSNAFTFRRVPSTFGHRRGIGGIDTRPALQGPTTNQALAVPQTGQLVTINTSQQFRILAYTLETEEDESVTITGANQV